MKYFLQIIGIAAIAASCKKGSGAGPGQPPGPFSIYTLQVGNSTTLTHVPVSSTIRISFTAPVDRSSVTGNVTLKDNNNTTLPVNTVYASGDSILLVQPVSPLQPISRYTITLSTGVRSVQKVPLSATTADNFVTSIDSSDKFPRISDSMLLDLVERQTLQYFWSFGHPVSGMARERNTSGDVVTTGGTGFGIMAMLAGIQRNFITRTDGLIRVQTTVNFLSTKAQRYHGAFPHWMDGSTGATIPFSSQDDGADLVETAYLIQGLLTARQFFTGASGAEASLRDSINSIWSKVEWNWFRQNGQNTLYWHWSPNFSWSTNQTVSGWNEALITYVLGASSPTDSIPKIVYDNGWARNGALRNGNTYFGVQLPLGPPGGGPLFFAHYSFLGLDPNGLTDTYADYKTQNTAHSLVNFNYCSANPQGYYGYSSQCWGLTASDDANGYAAHSPTNDGGFISPTAAISSLPYTPAQSMDALRFFYYQLGDKIWGTYGFTDAFSLASPWFATSYLAIDQGPEIIMIENYRSGLLWNLFMSCPEIKTGLKRLGFQSPRL